MPFKTCTYDCIYCQLNPTTCKTLQRKEWVPLSLILEDLEKKLDSRPDYVTLSGSGEPTLFRPLDRLIDGIRALTDLPIAVLTNGSLLGSEEVQQELHRADLVIPSLDAGSEATFRRVNRPHEGIDFARMLTGLIAFRRQFRNQYWLEVFLLGGYTDTEQELAEICRCVDLIRPDRVQLNTVTRPPAGDDALAVPRARLEEIAAMFAPRAEVIAEFHSAHALDPGQAGRDEILQLLRRRPCSIDDLVGGLGMHLHEVLKAIEHLSAAGLVRANQVGTALFYQSAKD